MVVEVVLWGVLLVLLWLYAFKKPEGYPPGRWGLPLIGYIPLTRRSIEQQVTDLRKEHGDIYLWRMGTQVMVFLHDRQLIKEAFNRPEIQDRPPWDTLKTRETVPKGIVASNGLRWQNNRRFTMRQLRDLGMGKSKLEEAMHTQASVMVEEFKKQAGRPAPMPYVVNVAIVNIIWQLVGGKVFTMTDPKVKEFGELIDTITRDLGLIAIADFFPWVKTLLPAWLMGRIFRFDQIDLLKSRILEFFNEEIRQHRATLDPDNPRDLIDGYLIEMDKRKDDPDSTFEEHDLSLLAFDLFAAGSETTKYTLTWLVYYLANNPQMQRKMQKEIDEVLPQGILPTLEDKPRMPYVEAVIHETLRVSSLSAFGVQHAVSQKTTLGGYIIPKGALINSSNTSVHYNPRYWKEPNKFLPERWIDNDGKFKSKQEGFLPFGIGKRQCAGEALARMELFVFATVLFQSLSFAAPPGKTLDLTPYPMNPLLHIPIPQDLIVSIRE